MSTFAGMEYAGTFLITDGSLDRHSERVLPEGLDVTHFRNAPVMYYNHHRSTSPDFAGAAATEIMPVGRWENIQLRDGSWYADAYIDTEDEIGRKLARKVKNGVITSASIGFRAKAWSDDEELKLQGQRGLTITESELLEVSIVDIPSNRNARRVSDIVQENNQKQADGEKSVEPIIFFNKGFKMSDKKDTFFDKVKSILGFKAETLEDALAELDDFSIDAVVEDKVQALMPDNRELEKSISDLRDTVKSLREDFAGIKIPADVSDELQEMKAAHEDLAAKFIESTKGEKKTQNAGVTSYSKTDDGKADRMAKYIEQLNSVK